MSDGAVLDWLAFLAAQFPTARPSGECAVLQPVLEARTSALVAVSLGASIVTALPHEAPSVTLCSYPTSARCECGDVVPVDEITSAGGHDVGGAPPDHCGPVTVTARCGHPESEHGTDEHCRTCCAVENIAGACEHAFTVSVPTEAEPA